MATNNIGKGRFKVGALVVGNPVSDGGPNPNIGLASAGGAITAVSAATSAVVTFTSTHNLNVGQIVTIAGVVNTSGTPAVNGTWVITAVNVASKTITLGGVVTTGQTWSSGGTATLVVPPVTGSSVAAAVTNATGTTTVTITAAGNWVVGQQVAISGVLGITGVNGTNTITVGGNGSFQFVPAVAAASAYTSGGIVYSFPLQQAVPSGPSPQVIKGVYTFQSITVVPAASLTNSTTPATQTATFTITLPGVNLGDFVIPQPVNDPLAAAAGAGLIYSAAVTAANIVTLTVGNITAATITAANATLTFDFLWIRLV